MIDPTPVQGHRVPAPRTIPEDAFWFVRDHYPKVFGFLRGMGCDPSLADEISNDACEILVARWSRLRASPKSTDQALKAYLYVTARRIFWKLGKREADRLNGLTGIDTIDLPAPPVRSMFPISDEVTEALEKLQSRHREVLLLRLLAGFSTAETAEIMKTKEGTVKYWLSQARKQMQDLIQATDHGEVQETSEETMR